MTPAADAPTRRLAVALLRKIEAVLGLGHLPARTVDEPVFEDAQFTLGGRPLTSIDVITATSGTTIFVESKRPPKPTS